jgi:hypothetical protein
MQLGYQKVKKTRLKWNWAVGPLLGVCFFTPVVQMTRHFPQLEP